MSQFIAMNRFKVAAGQEEAFAKVWKNRETRLREMPGFVSFSLLRGPRNEEEGYTLYASHSIWTSEQDFINWTRSENFRAAHRNAGQHKALYKGAPQFEGFTVVVHE